jgi:hypothetical protein
VSGNIISGTKTRTRNREDDKMLVSEWVSRHQSHTCYTGPCALVGARRAIRSLMSGVGWGDCRGLQ